MVLSRSCIGLKHDGTSCSSSPIHDEDQCLWHSPAHTEEAPRRGGKRREVAGLLRSLLVCGCNT
jgi:hypothetical protein